MYCDICDKRVDTDYDSEHFEHVVNAEDLENDGYTFCGLHTMMGGRQFKDVWVKYDKSGVVAALVDIRDKDGIRIEL
jgi:hypothetical protein